MKDKKWLWISVAVLDVAITVFFFVIHIMMLASVVGKSDTEIYQLRHSSTLIGYLARPENNMVYLFGFVVPLFVILAANIVGLVFYVKKQSKKEPVQVSDLTEEQKEALKKELLKDLEGDK